MACRICGNEKVRHFLSLGKTPLANSFLSKEDLKRDEPSFPLDVGFCEDCKLMQLTYVVPKELMFDNYVYVPSASTTFKLHFENMAKSLIDVVGMSPDSLAVDIGSNDGLLLGYFKATGCKVVGIEPAKNIADGANKNGIFTINGYFNERCVEKIVNNLGRADVVTATNVFAHIDDIKSVVRNVKDLLKDDGAFVIEAPYLVDMFEKMYFDTIYHEHLSYYSVTPLVRFFRDNGMEIFRVDRVALHGGSLRIFVKKSDGKLKPDGSVEKMLEEEASFGVDRVETYLNFAKRVQDVKEKLIGFVKNIKSQGRTIACYGAPAKGNTLLNFCGIGRESIDYIVDDSPLKQNLFAPGTHIPVVKSSMLDERRPDYILILAWNVAKEIIKKNEKYRLLGSKFIIPLPEPKVM